MQPNSSRDDAPLDPSDRWHCPQCGVLDVRVAASGQPTCPNCSAMMAPAHADDVDVTLTQAIPALPAGNRRPGAAPGRFASAMLPSGDRLGRYILEKEVGRGGMGVVYRALDQRLGRALALKILRVTEGLGEEERKLEVARFMEEAKLSAQLDHPGLVPVHELEQDPDAGVYFTMRLVKGKHLGEVIRLARGGQDGWNLPRAIGVLVKACDAIAYAHSKQVIHRDLKPSNIMVGRFGAVYVMDWGLAKVLGKPDAHDLRPDIDVDPASFTRITSDRQSSDDSTADTPLITMDGSVIGTPAYMPPEQAKGMIEDVDDLSDVYALGTILYHLLTGQPPYVAPNSRISRHTILGMVIQGPPERIEALNPTAPAELVAICNKAMARDRSRRYASSVALAEDLQAYLDGRVVRAYRTGAVAEFRSWVSRNRSTALAAAAVVLAVVSGLAGIVGIQSRHNREISRAKEATRRYLYDGNMQMVQQAWGSGAAFRARELLDRHRPQRGETDFRSFGWYYFDNLCRQSEQAPRLVHDEIVTTIAYSPNGQRLATGCNDGIVRLWATDDWSKTKLPGRHSAETGPYGAVDALLFTPDGSRLITAGREGDVMVRDLATDGEPFVLEGYVNPWLLRLSADGRYLAGASRDWRHVLLWRVDEIDALNRAPMKTAIQAADTGRILSVHFGSDSERLLTASDDGVTRMWNAAGGDLLATYCEPRPTDNPAIEVSPDGRLLATINEEDVVLFDLERGTELDRVSGPAQGVRQLFFSASGEQLAASGSSDQGEILIWRVADGQLDAVSSGNRHRGSVSVMTAMAGDRDILVTAGGSDNLVMVRDFKTGDLLSTFRGHRNELYAMGASSDGAFVATGGRDKEVRIWDLTKPPPTERMPHDVATVWSAAFSPDGALLCTAASDGQVRIWSVAGGDLIGKLHDQRWAQSARKPAHERSAQFVCFPPGGDGTKLISCGKGGRIRLWSLATRQLLGEIVDAHQSGTNALAFSRDGTTLYSSGDDGRVKAWRLTDLSGFAGDVQPLRVWGPIGEAAWALASSPTSNHIAAAGMTDDNAIFVWDLDRGDGDTNPRRLVGHQDNVTNLVFSPDGRMLASSSQDSSMRLWDVAGGKELPAPISPLRGHSGDVQAALFTSDGKSVATASMDGTIRIWDLMTGESKCALVGHLGGVQYVTQSPDSTMMASTSWDGTARIWRTR